MKLAMDLDISKKRILYVDILRIISIIAVIILHVSAKGFDNKYLPNSIEFQIHNFYNGIARFGVPVFVMISGVFLLNPLREYSWNKILCKIKKLLIAYLFWSTVYSIMRIFYNGYQLTEKRIIHGIFEGHYHTWFIFMICGLYIASPILKYIALNDKQIKYFIILSCIFVFIPSIIGIFKQYKLIRYFLDIINKIDIKIVSGYSSYFLLGYYFSTHSLKKNERINIYILGIISLILTFLLNGITCILMKKPVTIFFNNFLPNILCYAISVFVFFQYLCLNIKCSSKVVLISKISKYVFGVYLVHPMILDYIYFAYSRVILNHSIYSIPFLSVIVFIVSLSLAFIISKIPILNRYII